MNAEVVKVDSKQFGLEENKASEIESSFLPMKTEIEGLNKVYEELINAEITEELSVKAKSFYTLLKKVNGNNDRIHKSQKAYFLAGGKFADALKNKNKDIIDVMKEKTLSIVNHFEKLEEERIIKLSESRAEEITPFLHPEAQQPIDLGYMADDVWSNYLLGAKASYEARIKAKEEAENVRLEAEKKAELERLAELAEQERIRKENELLKKQAEEKEAERLAELKAIDEKEKAAQLERERLAKIEANKKAKIEAEVKAKADAEKAEFERKLKIANDAKLKAEKEVKAKADAEKAEKERLANVEAEKLEALRKADLAPEKEKISKWIDSMLISPIGTDGISDEGIVICNSIFEKFSAFKAWAQTQKNSIE